MATLTTALDTDFTPAAGNFDVQVIGGPVHLMRKNTSGAGYSLVGTIVNQAMTVENPVAGAVFRFASIRVSGTQPSVQADQ